tara:strand:- start:891 stop:2297 length:1407 start_codon:yes stop_codon:yes gene_type:complete
MNSRLVRDGTRIKSSHITLNHNKEETEPINLIYQYFIPKIASRVKEIKETLKRNVLNEQISKIYLLNERIYSTEELGIQSNKIIQIVIGKWITFKDVFSFVEKEKLNGYIIMANSDIFFDNTISNLHYTDLDCCQKMISLLRWEYRGEENLDECKIFGPRWDSQDTWIFHSKQNVLEKYRNWFDFSFGQPGCDNKIIYLLLILGVELNNDPNMFKTYHYHMETGRNYSKEVIPSPYGYLIPESINFENTNYAHYDYKHMVHWTSNFSKWNFMNDTKLIIKLSQLYCSIKKPILILDALNVNNMTDKNKKYFEACSGYFICEPYSVIMENYQYFYQNSDSIKKQILWYKLQNTLHNSYNTNNNWMNVYKDKSVLFITQDTVKQEMLYKNKDVHYSSVFNNKEQQFITWKYTMANNSNENNINELIKQIEKIKGNLEVVYIDIHSNVNNKIAYTIWHKLELSCIILSITY